MTGLPEGTLPRLPAFILAGGRSARFAQDAPETPDKARALWDGKPLLLHGAEMLAAHAGPIRVIARVGGAYDDLGVETVGDLRPDLGPLGGLHTACGLLEEAGWFWVTACDWIRSDPAWLGVLWAARTPEAQAVAFQAPDEAGRPRWEPLFALYHTDIAPLVRRRIAAGQRSMQGLIDAAPHAAVPVPAGWAAHVNVNRLGDLA